MPADTLQMDGDDALDLIVDIERSFGVWLGEDLSCVRTVGDLHAAVQRELGVARGTACPTSRVFYRLRALVGAGKASPAADLRMSWTGSPRSLRNAIHAATGWTGPRLVIGWAGCSLLCASVVAALVFGWWVSGLVVPPILAVGLLAVRLDRGSWSGDWATLGDIARAYAAHNQATLATEGARVSTATTWHALTTLIAGYGVDRAIIGTETRLCG